MSNYSQDDKEFLTRIAWMYYYGGMNQQSIAEKLKINRVKVTRLLQRIHKEGIVKIEIKSSHLELYTVEERLREASGLRYVVVVPEMDDAQRRDMSGCGTSLQ